jgi:hypothetical protein
MTIDISTGEFLIIDPDLEQPLKRVPVENGQYKIIFGNRTISLKNVEADCEGEYVKETTVQIDTEKHYVFKDTVNQIPKDQSEYLKLTGKYSIELWECNEED